MPIPAVALSYLYSADAMYKITAANARGVLAAACLLGGMDDLCNQAYHVARQSIGVDTISEWVDYVETLPRSNGSGTTSPASSQQQPSILGPFATALRDEVYNFLIVQLPSELDLQSDEGRTVLLNVFAQLG